MNIMRINTSLLALVATGLFVISVSAQPPATEKPATAVTPAASAPVAAAPAAPKPATSNPAIDFLNQIEAKNKDVTSLYGSFKQVRVNPMFSEEIKSTGEFWYSKPNKFRCDYHSPSPASFYLLADTGMYYTPELKQVEKYRLEAGDTAPINQMLVGFGLSTEKILEVFDVKLAEKQGDDANMIVIDFLSKDTSRTMEYQKITITFDKKKLEPRVLALQEEEDTVKVTLDTVKTNTAIDPKKFEAKFPADVEVIER